MSRVKEIIESRDVKAMAAELINLDKKCNSQRLYNAELLSKMLHLQGNIQVYCRVRPMSLNEIEKGYKSAVEALSENEVGCFDSRTNKWKSFAFDRVWGPDQSQQSVSKRPCRIRRPRPRCECQPTARCSERQSRPMASQDRQHRLPDPKHFESFPCRRLCRKNMNDKCE